MHVVPQVRRVRRSRAPRRSLYTPPQCGQREDIRVPLVLVCHTRHPDILHSALPASHHILTAHARLYDAHEVSIGTPRQCRHDSSPQQDRRLVLAVRSGGEPRLGYISGYNARVRQQIEPQLSASYPWCAGRVTTGARVGLPYLTKDFAATYGRASRLPRIVQGDCGLKWFK